MPMYKGRSKVFTRQIVVLNVVGSSPTRHPKSKTSQNTHHKRDLRGFLFL